MPHLRHPPSWRRAAARLITNKAETYDSRKAKRDARERELGNKILALPDKKYGVIYADPEWKFEFWSVEATRLGCPEAQGHGNASAMGKHAMRPRAGCRPSSAFPQQRAPSRIALPQSGRRSERKAIA